MAVSKFTEQDSMVLCDQNSIFCREVEGLPCGTPNSTKPIFLRGCTHALEILEPTGPERRSCRGNLTPGWTDRSIYEQLTAHGARTIGRRRCQTWTYDESFASACTKTRPPRAPPLIVARASPAYSFDLNAPKPTLRDPG